MYVIIFVFFLLSLQSLFIAEVSGKYTLPTWSMKQHVFVSPEVGVCSQFSICYLLTFLISVMCIQNNH
jgi:hypothetical protein